MNAGAAGSRPRLVVVDIDGVLADVRHRVHLVAGRRRDWDAFFAAADQDPDLAQGHSEIERATREGLGIVYLTGRPERCRPGTASWLERHGFPTAPLHMRPETDRRPARLFKVEALHALSTGADVVRVIDDDAAVVAAVRSAGYTVVHATWMDQDTDGVDEILQTVQEDEGRT